MLLKCDELGTGAVPILGLVRSNGSTATHLGRQAIFDAGGEVSGYELLYRPLPGRAEEFDPEVASARVITAGFLDVGLTRLAGNRDVYINVTRDLLLLLPCLPLPVDRVVLELVEGQLIDGKLLEVLERLVDTGFRLALDDFNPLEVSDSLLDLASIVKLDIQALDPEMLARQVETLRSTGKTLIAEKVETAAELDRCLALRFAGFQGYHLARPTIVAVDVSQRHQGAEWLGGQSGGDAARSWQTLSELALGR